MNTVHDHPPDTERSRQIAAYERTHGPLSPHARRTVAGAGYAKETPTHPLGNAADPLVNPRTPGNRAAVAACLREYYGGTLDRERLNKPVDRSDSVTGAELAGRFVTRLELSCALTVLAAREGLLYLTLTRHYRDNISRRAIAERWRQSPTTVSRNLDDALDAIITQIWRT